jgi:hypothetical protein
MTSVRVEITQGGISFPLNRGMNNVSLRERSALITISGTDAPILFDDVPLELQQIAGHVRVSSIDLSNRPGIHRVTVRALVGSLDYDFTTTTNKATWQEIEDMVAAVRLYALGPSRPFLYLGSGSEQQLQSIEQLVFWLQSRFGEIRLLSRSIDRAPAAKTQPRLRTSARAHHMDLRATAALLRERPSLMEKGDGGPIVLDGASYWPALIRSKSTEATIPQNEHRQLRTLLGQILAACDAASSLAPEATTYAPKLRELLRLRTLSAPAIGVADATPSLTESAIERRDPRYRRLRQLFLEYQSQFSHLSSSANIRAGLRDVWEIYQLFVAYMVGCAFGLKCSSRAASMRTRDQQGASMTGNGLLLFYDAQVPSQYLTSWRSSSERPAYERPDIVLIDEVSRRAIVLDTKFSVGDDGRCRSEHVFEMQGYLNSYGISSGGIVFPGDPHAGSVVSDGANSIAEIPFRASTLASSAAGLADLREKLEPLWTACSTST